MKIVKSAQRSIELLELLAAYPDGLTLSEIARKMGLANSTAYELVTTMTLSKYVKADTATKTYRLGSRVLSLAARYLQDAPDFARARQLADLLMREFHMPVRIAVLSEDRALVVREHGFPASVERAGSADGLGVPADESALGHALLCFSTEEERKHFWHRRRQNAGARHERWAVFNRKLDEAAALGLAFDAKELPGFYCIAVPVVGSGGAVEAAVAVYADKAGTSDSRLKQLLHRVFELAAELNGLPRSLPASGEGGRDKMIYVSLPNLDSQKALVYLDVLDAEAGREGVQWLFSDCQDDVRKQQILLEWVLDTFRPDCAVINPVSAVHSDEVFRLCAGQRVPAICFQRPSRSRYVDYYVGGDAYEQGVMQMEYVARRLKGRGNVVILEGDPYNENARNMVIGYHHVLKRHPGLHLLESVPIPNWGRDEAGQTIADLLERGERIDAVVAGTDRMAEGVIEALRRYKRSGKVFVVGGDGDRSAVRLIRKREQHATVFQHPVEAARSVLGAAAALAHGRPHPRGMVRKNIVHDYPGKEVLALTIPYSFVDAANVDELDRYWNAVGAAHLGESRNDADRENTGDPYRTEPDRCGS